MTFSIAIPVHNGETYLGETLASAVTQTRPADEIIVVDDASSDRSAEIIQSVEWAGAVRYVFNEPSTGFVDAWNRVVRLARSDYVTILHQDDLLDPGYLSAVEKALTAFPQCRHLYTGYSYIDENGKRIGESPRPHVSTPELVRGSEYAHRYLVGVVRNRHIHRCPGATTSRALLLDKCTYRTEAGLIADDDFFLRVGQFTDVIGISQPLASFRRHGKSETAKLESLSYRLAEDYLFQTKEYQNNHPFLTKSDIALIHNQAVRFINSYFLESILRGDPEWLEKAASLRGAFERLTGEYFNIRCSAGARLLWSLPRRMQPDSLSFALLSFALRGYMKAKRILLP